MTNNFEAMVTDLTTRSLLENRQLIPPFIEGLSKLEELKILIKELPRSVKLQQRRTALINAYYLGKILQEVDKADAIKYKRQLTYHYQVMARYTYDLFESAPEQILHTQFISVQRIRSTPRKKLLQLREKLLEFVVGSQILVEEDCHGDSGHGE
jgi:hypothetical protein